MTVVKGKTVGLSISLPLPLVAALDEEAEKRQEGRARTLTAILGERYPDVEVQVVVVNNGRKEEATAERRD